VVSKNNCSKKDKKTAISFDNKEPHSKKFGFATRRSRNLSTLLQIWAEVLKEKMLYGKAAMAGVHSTLFAEKSHRK
jgi:hypothetical protein